MENARVAQATNSNVAKCQMEFLFKEACLDNNANALDMECCILILIIKLHSFLSSNHRKQVKEAYANKSNVFSAPRRH
jgi:hypothetical protein